MIKSYYKITEVSVCDRTIKTFESKLNNRPRKVLGWLSHIEYLMKQDGCG